MIRLILQKVKFDKHGTIVKNLVINGTKYYEQITPAMPCGESLLRGWHNINPDQLPASLVLYVMTEDRPVHLPQKT